MRSPWRHFLWVVVLCASCATGGVKDGPMSPEDALRLRVDAYWRAQAEQRWRDLPAFVDRESLEAGRATAARMEKFAHTSRVLSWEPESFEVEGDRARVVVRVERELRHPLLGPKPYRVVQQVEDRWVRRADGWYVVVEQPSLEKARERLRAKGVP